jgi:hypothetical protein
MFRKKDREQMNRIEAMLLRNLEIPRLRELERAARQSHEAAQNRQLAGDEFEIKNILSQREFRQEEFNKAADNRSAAEWKLIDLEHDA